jgi:hypothetical protein
MEGKKLTVGTIILRLFDCFHSIVLLLLNQCQELLALGSSHAPGSSPLLTEERRSNLDVLGIQLLSVEQHVEEHVVSAATTLVTVGARTSTRQHTPICKVKRCRVSTQIEKLSMFGINALFCTEMGKIAQRPSRALSWRDANSSLHGIKLLNREVLGFVFVMSIAILIMLAARVM